MSTGGAFAAALSDPALIGGLVNPGLAFVVLAEFTSVFNDGCVSVEGAVLVPVGAPALVELLDAVGLTAFLTAAFVSELFAGLAALLSD